MAVLNITPDSFSDGGQWFSRGRPDLDAVLRRAQLAVSEGASILDVGGESTRPGASKPGVQEEMDRVLPVIELLRANFDVVLSLDSSRPEVMTEGLSRGVGLLNDVRALQSPGALALAASADCPVCLMHMRGEPEDMQRAPRYDNVLSEVNNWLLERVASCEQAGLKGKRIILDPGFGFGKTLAHNLTLFKALPELVALGYPVMVGVSRKSMLGQITGRDVEDRVVASAIMAAEATRLGAAILRVHDVAATIDAVKIGMALMESE